MVVPWRRGGGVVLLFWWWCSGGDLVVCKHILVFGLAQAEHLADIWLSFVLAFTILICYTLIMFETTKS